MALDRPEHWAHKVSPTFHGRDILAPVAGLLAVGLAPETLGSPLAQLVELAIPEARICADHALGEVLLVDSFGNLITNIPADRLPRAALGAELSVECKGQMIAGLQTAYDVAPPPRPAGQRR